MIKYININEKVGIVLDTILDKYEHIDKILKCFCAGEEIWVIKTKKNEVATIVSKYRDWIKGSDGYFIETGSTDSALLNKNKSFKISKESWGKILVRKYHIPVGG